jgi:tetratricopeptide (TPR) repeat protein
MRSEELPEPLKIDGHNLSWLDSIEQRVETFWDRPLLQHYTNHGIDHSQRIIKALGALLEDFPDLLNQHERFILLASIYLHDIGMQSPPHAGLPKKAEYTFEEMEKIREVHNESSAQMIKESIASGPECPLGLENCKDYAKYIAEVSRYHRVLDLTKLDDTAIGFEPVRLQLLAALLRLGDALDADYRRVNMDFLSLREIPVESKYHWWCHHYVQSVLIQKGHIELYFRIPEKYENSKVIVVIEKRIKESVSEALSNVYDILDGHGMRLYPNVEIRSVEFLPEGSLQAIPDDLCEFIEVHVLKTVERSEKESARTGLVWYADGVPFSDDADVVTCLSEVFGLVEEERYMDAAEKIERCRLLTMAPRDRMIFSITTGHCYSTLGKFVEAERCYKDALSISERQDLQHVYEKDTAQIRGTALESIGRIFWAKGDLDQALKYLEDALEIDRQIGYKQGEANALGNIGIISRDKGDRDQALKYLEDALEIHKQIGCKQGEANQLGNIGFIFSIKGDLDQALKYLEDALEIDRQIGCKQREADDLGSISIIFRDKGDLDQALKYLEDALEIDRQIGYKQGEANAIGNIGLLFRAKGDRDQALKYHKDALEIHRQIGYKQGEAIDLGNIGLLYSDKGDLDQALKYHKDALDIDREIGYKQGEANQLGSIGFICGNKGDLDQALKYHKDALDIDRQIGYKQGEANQLGNMGLIYSDKGDLDQALKYLEDALEILTRFGLTYGRQIIENAIRNIKREK